MKRGTGVKVGQEHVDNVLTAASIQELSISMTVGKSVWKPNGCAGKDTRAALEVHGFLTNKNGFPT